MNKKKKTGSGKKFETTHSLRITVLKPTMDEVVCSPSLNLFGTAARDVFKHMSFQFLGIVGVSAVVRRDIGLGLTDKKLDAVLVRQQVVLLVIR